MPTATFDITEKAIDFIHYTIKGMPGNAGQETLVKRLVESGIDGTMTVTVTVDAGDIEFEAESDNNLQYSSDHPEAIEVIMKRAADAGDFFANLAEVPGPFSFAAALSSGDWKVVGYDGVINV
jgi:hypothetical protein